MGAVATSMAILGAGGNRWPTLRSQGPGADGRTSVGQKVIRVADAGKPYSREAAGAVMLPENPAPPQGTGVAVPPLAQVPAGTQTAQAVTPERAAVLAEQKRLAAMAARCVAGDGSAWEELARTQHRRIYGICYRFTGSPTEAEDVTQEVFIKVFRSLASFDPAKGAFTTWLTTLTRNMLVDTYRRNRQDRVTDSLDESAGADDDGPTRLDRLADTARSQEQHVAGNELRVQIQAALAKVSVELREAVILRDLEDMDYKDIAETLGCPVGTVKSRISRGRAELAKLLKSLEGQVM
jgi:RNA polymerase sigma-70 factor (ECF subfamily)